MSGRVLSVETFREWIAELERAIRREQRGPGGVRGVASYSELIGNVCWHFVREESPRWFKQSLELRRSVGWEPNSISAGLLWKLGQREELGSECQRAIAIHEDRLASLRRATVPSERFKAQEHASSVRQALHQLAVLNLLSSEYEKAIEWGHEGLAENAQPRPALDGRGHAPSAALLFVRDFASSTLRQDVAGMMAALRALRRSLEMWPTDAGSLIAELYRFGEERIRVL